MKKEDIKIGEMYLYRGENAYCIGKIGDNYAFETKRSNCNLTDKMRKEYDLLPKHYANTYFCFSGIEDNLTLKYIDFRGTTLDLTKIYLFSNEAYKSKYVKMNPCMINNNLSSNKHTFRREDGRIETKIGFPVSDVNWCIVKASPQEVIWFNNCVKTGKYTPLKKPSIINYINF